MFGTYGIQDDKDYLLLIYIDKIRGFSHRLRYFSEEASLFFPLALKATLTNRNSLLTNPIKSVDSITDSNFVPIQEELAWKIPGKVV